MIRVLVTIHMNSSDFACLSWHEIGGERSGLEQVARNESRVLELE